MSEEKIVPSEKLGELLKRYQKEKKAFFAFEYFPPNTPEGREALISKVVDLNFLKPLYNDIAWGAGGSSKELDIVGLGKSVNDSAKTDQTQIHLTLTGMSKNQLRNKLKEAKELGVRNILALRGDPPRSIYKENKEENEKAVEDYWSSEYDDLRFAKDFVRWIRSETGDHFTISVAGYPEGHPKGSYENDLKYLKEKVDAGADFVITQFFYDVDQFMKFKKDCEKIIPGVPVLPGIMPIANYSNWKKLLGYCNVSIPKWMQDKMEKVDLSNRDEVSDFGIECCVRVCRELMKQGVNGFLFYTLNLSKSCTSILHELGYLDEEKGIDRKRLFLNFPWLATKEEGLCTPLFWSTRPKSFFTRTKDWGKLPTKPEDYKEKECQEYAAFTGTKMYKDAQTKGYWGKDLLKNKEEGGGISSIFERFLQRKVPKLPWVKSTMKKETELILEDLIQINKKGYYTINSQPAANGLPSNHPQQGWKTTKEENNNNNGTIWKKAYLEFFCDSEKGENLLKKLKKNTKKKNLSYLACKRNGDVQTNLSEGEVITVGWGKFGDREYQPSIVDKSSFMGWRPEAFALWDEWKLIYEKDSQDYKVIEDIQNDSYLFLVLDNDYQKGNIFEVFQ